jgi:elongation factor G
MDVELSLRVLDGAVVLLDGVAGVEPQTEGVWRQADRYDLPRICYVNKLDRAGASLERSIDALVERLGARPAVVQLPLGSEAEFTGIIDLVNDCAHLWTGDDVRFDTIAVPDALVRETAEARQRLIEVCADFDDAVADAFLGGRAPLVDALHGALRAGCHRGELVPVLCGSAYKKRGVQQLLDAIVRYLPAPVDRPPVVGAGGQQRLSSNDQPACALVFKTVQDDFGQLALARVYAGTLDKGSRVLNARTGRVQRVGRLVRVFADRRLQIQQATTGDIVGISLGDAAAGDTLCDPAHPIELTRPSLAKPVMRLTIEPKTRSDRVRLGPALAKIVTADPSLRLETDPETGQTLLCGLGELHLEVAIARLREPYGVEVRVGEPRVAYRAALSCDVEHRFRYSKQTGGPGHFAEVVLVIGPASAGSGLLFENEIRAGTIPAEFIPGVRAGVEAAMHAGILGGYPLFDVHVRLIDGNTHPNDSSELDFEIASRRCFLEAAARAGAYLLEPIMRLEVTVPEAQVGAVIGDLGARRGRVREMVDGASELIIVAAAPLAELFGYARTLRSLTSGRGTFTMALDSYQAVPNVVARRVLESS